MILVFVKFCAAYFSYQKNFLIHMQSCECDTLLKCVCNDENSTKLSSVCV